MNKNELTVIEQKSLEVIQDQPIMDKLLLAASNGMSIDFIERFMDLAERNQKREAENAFHKAFAAFKANPPKIIKDKLVNYTLKTGGTTKYKHATIGAVVGAIIEGMSKHGLSHCWSLSQAADKVTVTCRVTHEMGHSESTTLTAGVDLSGNKNAIQGIGSTVTYLERYTIQAATGIAVLEIDDDGQTHKPSPPKDADFYIDKLDKEMSASSGKEYVAIAAFQAKNQKAINALPDKDKEAVLKNIAYMTKEFPPPKSPALLSIEATCPTFKNLDDFTLAWEEKVKPILPKMPKHEAEAAEKIRIATINRLQGEA